jgi:hypothetical protein
MKLAATPMMAGTAVSPGQVQTDVSVRVTYQLVPGS